MARFLEDLVFQCRLEVLGESALKDLLSNPDVHIAGVAYHKAAAQKATDPKIRQRHLDQIKHHSKEAERLQKMLRSGGKSEGLSRSLASKKKDAEKSRGDDGARDDDDETDDEREERLARERHRFSEKWSERNQAKSATSERMQQRFSAQKRHKVLSGALKAIASHARHAVKSTDK